MTTLTSRISAPQSHILPVCRALKSPEERAAAHAIVSRQYGKLGYRIVEGGSVIADFLQPPHGIVFGAFIDNVLYGTVGVVRDSQKGLPMDNPFHAALAPYRNLGSVAEVVQFAVDLDIYKAQEGARSQFASIPLFASVFSYAKQTHTDFLSVTTNYDHARFYGLLGFTEIGLVEKYASVDNEGVAQILKVKTFQQQESTASGIIHDILNTASQLDPDPVAV